MTREIDRGRHFAILVGRSARRKGTDDTFAVAVADKNLECGSIQPGIRYYDPDDDPPQVWPLFAQMQPKSKGWYAFYLRACGRIAVKVTDSMKSGHPALPRRKSEDAHKKAERIVHAYACKLNRARRGTSACRRGLAEERRIAAANQRSAARTTSTGRSRR